jgi:hypothetical protein
MSLVFIIEIGDRLFSVRYELWPTKQLSLKITTAAECGLYKI